MTTHNTSNDTLLNTKEVMEKFKFASTGAVRKWASVNNVPRSWGKYWESDVIAYRMR